MKNKYINHSHLSESEFENLVRCFANEMPSLQIAAETGLNRNTVNRIVGLIRQRLLDLQKGSVIVPRNLHLESVKFAFRAMAVTPSLNSAREQIRVAILNAEGSIHCEVVSSDTILTIVHLLNGKIKEIPETQDVRKEVVGVLMLLAKEFNGRIDSTGKILEVSSDEECVAQIHDFVRYAKKIFSTRRGINVDNFSLHFSECNYRWNHRNSDLYSLLLKEFENNPL